MKIKANKKEIDEKIKLINNCFISIYLLMSTFVSRCLCIKREGIVPTPGTILKRGQQFLLPLFF